MRGLLEKDVRILLGRKNTLVMFLIIMAVMGYAMGSTFIIGYGCMLFGILAVGSISYDEFDNGFPFLMSLPITRREYVVEKFLFCGALTGIGWVVSAVIGAVFAVVGGEMPMFIDMWQENVAILMVFLAVVAVLIAVQLKFDVEKSRTVLLIIGGAVVAVAVIANKFMPKELSGALTVFENTSDLAILGMISIIAILVILISFFATVRIMENKQF